MALPASLPRWIYASACKHITERANSRITFYEGLDKDSTPQTGAEFRMDGPRDTALSQGYWEIWIAINIYVQVSMRDTDFHEKYRVIGDLMAALDTTIPVMMLGTDPGDNPTQQIGCFTVIHDKFNRIQANYFGQVSGTDRLEQMTVEARYHMYYTETA